MKRLPITHYEWMLSNEGIRDYIEDLFVKYGSEFMEFEDFGKKFETDPGMLNILEMYGQGNANLLVRQFYHAVRMKANGEKLYYISKDVCDVLYNTRLTIDAEFIESPFEQIYIYTDQDKLTISDHTGTMPMKGIYIQVCRESDGFKRLRFIVTSNCTSIKNGKDINYFATFKIPDHGNLEDIADSHVQDFIEGSVMRILNEDIDLKSLRQSFIFAVNSLLYIGCKGVNLTTFNPENLLEISKRKKNPAKSEEVRRLIGRVAQMPYIIVNPIQSSKQISCGGVGKKLDHQVLVSGHWKGQWKGSESDNTRKKEIIRIDSYLKGLELPKVKSKPYVVK